MKLWMTVYDAVYPRRRPLVLALYAAFAGAAYAIAYLLRFEFVVPPVYSDVFLYTLPIVLVVRAIFAAAFGLSSGRWRFVSTPDLVRLTAATVTGSLVLLVVASWLPEPTIPRSVLLLEMLLTFQATAGVWIAYRLAFERLRHARAAARYELKRVLIVGAGEAGNLLAREILRTPTGYRLVGMIDDDPRKRGARVNGVLVFGGVKRIPAIVRERGIDEIIIAIPSAGPAELRRLVEACEESNVPFKVLPGIQEVMRGQVGLNQLRELRIEDLLGREPVQLELPELEADLSGRCVLITGAAGSIGSELARQVALHRPDTLVLFDQAETEMFYLELELRREQPDLRLVSVIGDIVDERAVESAFTRYRPDRVFHAAAYKHVPLLESNPDQAIRNNVIGTHVVGDAAGRHNAGKFILVSTDKAVRPANVMGATKRLAELAVLELQGRHPATSFGAVRFGNVLGSRGSVLPVFRRQLADRQPLTVTHPEVTRYFMTIPEAVQLILQASLLPELRGQIAMLEMGQPVRILDLAKNFLRLSGRPVREGDTIVFSGLRPGEKLHEELSAPGEEATATAVPKVYVLRTTADADLSVGRLIRRWQEGEAEQDMLSDLTRVFDGLAGAPKPEPVPVPSSDERQTAA